MSKRRKLCAGGETPPAQGHSSLSGNIDRISELPDDDLFRIISYLPPRDVIRTSLLSRRWKHACAVHSRSVLEFSWSSMFSPSAVKDEFYRDKVVSRVNRFLEFYQGPHNIHKLLIILSLGADSAGHLDNWLSFAARMRTKSLVLDLESRDNVKPESYLVHEEAFEGVVSRLEYLVLVSCILPPNFINRFSNLRTLGLCKLPLRSHGSQSLFSGLENLCKLQLCMCRLPRKIFFGSLPLLNDLRLQNCYGTREIELSNSKLTKLQCVSKLPITKIVFTSAPELIELSYSVSGPGLEYAFGGLPRELPKLRTLRLFAIANWVRRVPEQVGVFSKVSNLMLLFDLRTKFDTMKMFSILDGFPLLKKLTLQVICCVRKPEMCGPNDGYMIHQHLEEVEICGFFSCATLTVFAADLILCAPRLRKMLIWRGVKVESSYGWRICSPLTIGKSLSWKEGEHLQLLVLKKLAERSGVKVIVM
ncbi:hypothetical protein Dimus_009954 [Dionaea muscipula]